MQAKRKDSPCVTFLTLYIINKEVRMIIIYAYEDTWKINEKNLYALIIIQYGKRQNNKKKAKLAIAKKA